MASALAPSDVDAQATVTDFSDYTEYLRSDLFRSLTLIRDLDVAYRQATREVDHLTRIYGDEKLVRASGKTPLEIRTDFSQHLDRAVSSRECAFAEAQRLYDTCDRHATRLSSILTKLQALPLPPSRDPTPVPQPSPVHQRITLRLDPSRAGRGRRYGSLGFGDDSDWDMRSFSPLPMPKSKVGEKRKRGRPPKHSHSGTIRLTAHPRPPRSESHSHVPKQPRAKRLFAISSRDALAALEPPPPDAEIGSEHAPWLRLTQYELAVLRKRMKKNSAWQPSETMIHRELKTLERGVEAHRAEVKRRADEGLPPLPDSLLPTAEQIASGTAVAPTIDGEKSSGGTEDLELVNRGMKLNEAKKMKKEAQARLAAEMAAANSTSVVTTEAAMLSISDVSRQFQDLQALLSKSAPPSPLPLTAMDKAKKSPTKAGAPITPIPLPAGAAAAEGSSDLPLRSENSAAGTSKKRKRSDGSISVTVSKSTSPTIRITVVKDGVPVETPQATGKSNATVSTLALTQPPPSASSVSSRPKREGSAANVTPIPPPETPRADGSASSHSVSITSAANKAAADGLRASSSSETPVPPPNPAFANGKPRSYSSAPTAASSRPVRERRSMPASNAESAAAAKQSVTPTRKVSPPGLTLHDVSSDSSPLSSGGEASDEEPDLGNRRSRRGTEADRDDDDHSSQEPTYCICQQESRDTMIACDNFTCDIEWFHLSCVGLKREPPDGRRWFCPNCRDGKDERRLKRSIAAARKKEAEEAEAAAIAAPAAFASTRRDHGTRQPPSKRRRR